MSKAFSLFGSVSESRTLGPGAWALGELPFQAWLGDTEGADVLANQYR